MKKLIFICLLTPMAMGFFPAGSQTYEGYTLYSKMGNTKTYLLGMDKSIYHQWSSSVATGYSCYLLEDGILLRTGQYMGNQLQGAAICGMVQKIDWNGNLLWQYIYSSSTYCTHHDIHPMPNGNVLMISYEVKSATEVVQAGGAQSIIMWPDKILEVQPDGTNGGTIVWEWHAWDHLIQDHDASKNNYGVVSDHPELLNINYQAQKEWMHCNGIDYNPELDQIIFSSHNLNEFYVIDHSTTTAEAAGHTGGNAGMGGDFLYRWGNPAAYGRGTSANQVFKIVHDAHWIPTGIPGAGNMVAFNNTGGTGNKSCVDMITPPLNGYNYTLEEGAAYEPSQPDWRHLCLSNAQSQSNSQRLPNGNWLVCIASSGYIYEIDSLQNTLWSFTAGGSVAKAYRYSPCYVNGTIPDTPVITESGDTLYSSKSTGNQWFLDEEAIPGATNNYLVPSVNGTYQVQVTDESGCTSEMSDPFIYLSTGDTDTDNLAQVQVFPNPTNGIVQVSIPGVMTESVRILVTDLYGKVVMDQTGSLLLDLSNIQNGMYVMTVRSEEKLLGQKKIILIR